MVESRRGGTAQSQKNNIEHIVACQAAIRAIDEAIADERAIVSKTVVLAIDDIDRENLVNSRFKEG